MIMRASALVVLLYLSLVPTLYAQEQSQSERLQQAVEFLRLDSLDAAWELLTGLETSQAVLLKSRILLKRGNINEAYERVLPITDDPLPALREEAQYTLAVIEYWRRNYGEVLSISADLKNRSRTSTMRREAERLYDQTLSWISPLQASDILAKVLEDDIRRDIIHSQVRKLDWVDALNWYEDHKSWMPSSESALSEAIEQALTNAARHAAYSRTFVSRPPTGVIYTLGVILPEYSQNRDFLPINRNLYAGIQAAIDTYNEQSTNSKFKLALFRLDEDLSNVGDIGQWAENEHVDAVIGPLTSSQVRATARELQNLRTPLFAPLANDPSLSSASDKVFQVNPGVEQRAKAFAEFAYSTMRYRSVALVSDGSDIANMELDVFKDRFLTLGGTVEYTFDPLDLQNPGKFDEQAMMLTSDPFLIDSLQTKHVDALVVSLGSGQSEPLFNLVITALDAVSSRVSILGTQDLNIIRIPSRVKRDYNVFTYSPYDENPVGSQILDFDSKYRAYTSQAPDLYGYLGFDIARYITRLTDNSPNPSMWLQSISDEAPYRGLAVPVAFDENRVNRRVYFYKLTDPDKIQIGN
jgi:ABC-type branched-subunit amino acid transport system substrate-binding protein